MTLYNPNLDLVNVYIIMCIQNFFKFCPLVLKILSGNEMVMDLRNNRKTEGQGKSSIAPLFQSGAIITVICSLKHTKICPFL